MNIAHLDIRLEKNCINDNTLSPILIDFDRSTTPHSLPPVYLQLYTIHVVLGASLYSTTAAYLSHTSHTIYYIFFPDDKACLEKYM